MRLSLLLRLTEPRILMGRDSGSPAPPCPMTTNRDCSPRKREASAPSGLVLSCLPTGCEKSSVCARRVPPVLALPGFMIVVGMSKQTERRDPGVDTMEQAWNRGIAKRGWLPSVLPRLPTPARGGVVNPWKWELRWDWRLMYFVPQDQGFSCRFPGRTGRATD